MQYTKSNNTIESEDNLLKWEAIEHVYKKSKAKVKEAMENFNVSECGGNNIDEAAGVDGGPSTHDHNNTLNESNLQGGFYENLDGVKNELLISMMKMFESNLRL